MGKRNYIDIDWPDLFKPIPGLDQEKYNRIRINREVIPIIFVPGIMGSRLKNKKTGEIVWDPDREIMCMFRKYGGFWNTPAQRKRMLIGNSFNGSYLEVDEDNHDHNRKVNSPLDPYRAARGWGGVYWGSYGNFLETLQNHQWSQHVDYGPTSAEELRRRTKLNDMIGICFEFPVWAFGYNWTDTNRESGHKLAEKIEKIIGWYRSKGRLCTYVILVSHSMGGLVCRSACKLWNAENNVLGVIHGVQPVTGAAAAYWRMKAGFERVGTGFLNRFCSKASAWVLGTNGEEVTCIMGNSPGCLELLPNQLYRNNKQEAAWLKIPAANGGFTSLPRMGNPYKEIYKEGNRYWRLIDPDWLSPKDKGGTEIAQNATRTTSWNSFITCLNKAEFFHSCLRDSCHKRTYQFFSSMLNTVDFIGFEQELLSLQKQEQPSAFKFSTSIATSPASTTLSRGNSIMYSDGDDIQIPSSINPTTRRVKLLHPNNYHGGGDGTVPVSSATALKMVLNSHQLKGLPHQEVYADRSAIEYVVGAIVKLANGIMDREVSASTKRIGG
ncbi:esterase/lipase family protein [Geomesophilobacter sediminis]|uniref:Alpha/beta hydrolase n=1 Tax=Geomesophilobacter sediminis TaxID=2798584 RepID=A0A8J7S9R9_9BACT|nr:alpha/beta hydrolase [Geomesophilobacter sediminis]MBJ6727000.1 alpha/beta hydrolase [Geomesophilobacter sediminis]